jgi:hypothetical protein
MEDAQNNHAVVLDYKRNAGAPLEADNPQSGPVVTAHSATLGKGVETPEKGIKAGDIGACNGFACVGHR